jgi:alkanesulfonate monooxygenase SsuD/methylene tetrahydromethanopterin reductase-like flavin-dependent oxidoreductase (luciferase family)
MRFLIAVYARVTPAKLLAQQALTFDAFTGGRLLMNLINGRDNIMEPTASPHRTTTDTSWAKPTGGSSIAATLQEG